MDKDQERDIIETLQKAGLPYTEASNFVKQPRATVEKLRNEIILLLANRVFILEDKLKEQQQQIGELSAKVWRLEER